MRKIHLNSRILGLGYGAVDSCACSSKSDHVGKFASPF
jgi:hypothetical protein